MAEAPPKTTSGSLTPTIYKYPGVKQLVPHIKKTDYKLYLALSGLDDNAKTVTNIINNPNPIQPPGATLTPGTKMFVECAFPGKPAADQVVLLAGAPTEGIFDIDLAESFGSVGANPTGTVVYTLSVESLVDLSVKTGTITISPSGVFVFTTTGHVTIPFVANDRISIKFQHATDLTLSDVIIVLGCKVAGGAGDGTTGTGTGTVTKVTATAPVTITSDPTTTPNVVVPVMLASGSSHKSGLVPDPGATAGTSKFLREDATYAVPPGTSVSPTANQNTRSVGVTFDGAGSVLLGTLTRCIVIPFGGTITKAELISDIVGSVVIDIKTVVFGSYTGPGSATSITASAKPNLSSTISYTDSTLTGWTTALAINTVMVFVMSAPTAITWCTLVLTILAN